MLLQIMLMLVIGATSLPARPDLVEYGQAKAGAGTLVWIGGSTLSQQLRFVGDPANGQVYAIDRGGQFYPLLIEQPPTTLVIDTAKVERQAPGLLNELDRQRRETMTTRMRAVNDSLVAAGYSSESVATAIGQDILSRSDLIDSVRVVGNQVVYHWRGWRLAAWFTAGPRLKEIPRNVQFQRYAEGIITHLNQGDMVVFGWNGSYTVVPQRQALLCLAEIDRLRRGEQPVGQLLSNELVTVPIKLNRSVDNWLKQANKGE